MYVTSEKGYPIVVSYKLKVRRKMHCFQFSDIEFIMVDGKIIINAKGAKETTPPRILISVIETAFRQANCGYRWQKAYKSG